MSGSGAAGGASGRGSGGGRLDDGLVAAGVDRISHQLKNPLQTIAVNLEVLRLEAERGASAGEAGGDGEIERLTGVISGGVQTLDRRIGMLVALARRSGEAHPRRVSLGEYVRRASATFQLGDADYGRGLEVEVPGEEGDVEVLVRPGWLLAFLLEAAAGAHGAAGALLRVAAGEECARVELSTPAVGHGSAEGEDGPERTERLAGLLRRAGAEDVGTASGGGIVARFGAA